jgi:hypothetical protein
MPTEIVSKTVYSLYYPETASIIEEICRDFPHDIYREAWTKKQDPLHDQFLNTWLSHLGSPVFGNTLDFPHRYPANGSSEAIRETVADFAVESQARKIPSRLHVFQGEYEGYRAYAEAYGIEVVEHARNHSHPNDWQLAAQNVNKQMRDGDRFYISQPSSIDGNIWPHYDEFVAEMAKHNPGVGIYLDLCYLGTTTWPWKIKNINSFNVAAVFFSLSKVYGVYYHRIGGVFTRKPLPGLYGNQWFKNLLSLRIGHQLMLRLVNSLPKQYKDLQQEAVDAIEEQGYPNDVVNIQPSDVVLLAHGKGPGFHDWDTQLARGKTLRYCLTPYMGRKLGQ